MTEPASPTNPYQAPGDPGAEELASLLETLEPLHRSAGWMKFIGVMFIIGGAFAVLTIWGILIAWLLIWLGIDLFAAASRVQQAYASNDPAFIRQGLQRLQRYFRLFGILMIIYAAIIPIAIVAALLIPALLLARKH